MRQGIHTYMLVYICTPTHTHTHKKHIHTYVHIFIPQKVSTNPPFHCADREDRKIG